jgi:hypothetical protein
MGVPDYIRLRKEDSSESFVIAHRKDLGSLVCPLADQAIIHTRYILNVVMRLVAGLP